MSRPLIGLASVAVLAIIAIVIGGSILIPRTQGHPVHLQARPGETVRIPGNLTLKLSTYKVQSTGGTNAVRALWIADNPSSTSAALAGSFWAGTGSGIQKVQPAPRLTLPANSQRIVFLHFAVPSSRNLALGYDNGDVHVTWNLLRD